MRRVHPAICFALAVSERTDPSLLQSQEFEVLQRHCKALVFAHVRRDEAQALDRLLLVIDVGVLCFERGHDPSGDHAYRCILTRCTLRRRDFVRQRVARDAHARAVVRVLLAEKLDQIGVADLVFLAVLLDTLVAHLDHLLKPDHLLERERLEFAAALLEGDAREKSVMNLSAHEIESFDEMNNRQMTGLSAVEIFNNTGCGIRTHAEFCSNRF